MSAASKASPFWFAVVLLLATPTIAADLSGRWTLTFDPDFSGNPASVDCTFKQDGGKRLTVPRQRPTK